LSIYYSLGTIYYCRIDCAEVWFVPTKKKVNHSEKVKTLTEIKVEE